MGINRGRRTLMELRAHPTAQLFTACPVLGASTSKGDACGINNRMDQREKLVHRYGVLQRRLSSFD